MRESVFVNGFVKDDPHSKCGGIINVLLSFPFLCSLFLSLHFANKHTTKPRNKNMSCYRSKLSWFLLLFSCLFLYKSQPISASHFYPSSDPAEIGVFEDFQGQVLPWETQRRALAEENSTLILAAERTRRKDPLNHFDKYTGGWNISNSHYWASVCFLAAPFFVIAAAWFAIFAFIQFIICIRHCCCRLEPYGYSRTAYALSLFLLILFTIVAIIGCVFLYTGQGKLHDSTQDTLHYAVDQANYTAENLRNVSDYLSAAEKIKVDKALLGVDVQARTAEIQTKINSSAVMVTKKTSENSEKIEHGLDSMRKALIIVAAVMLFLTFLGFVVSIFGLECLVYTLVVFGWVLVAGTFILAGVFHVVHNVAADACVSMEQWVQNPTAHTALDDIIPCVDNATAQETLIQTKNVSHQLVSIVDNVITAIANQDLPPIPSPAYYNQSGPKIPILCNPFNNDLTSRQCAAGEVELQNATEVFKRYTCQVSPAGRCITPGRLTPEFYTQMAAAVNVSFGLYRYGPFLKDLQDCTFVRNTFNHVTTSNCPSLRRFSQWVYIGLVMVSGAVMLSVFFWVVYARERRHRVYAKQFMARS